MLPVDARKITWGVLGTLGGVSLIVFALLYLLVADPQSEAAPERPDYAATRAELDAAAKEKMGSYGWVDRDKGVVHIPVAEAKKLWLEERSGK
ncbi:MAG: hypothetical protein ACYTHK_13930 [Planctomycetota bacterium]|jgi:hypothetical protein